MAEEDLAEGMRSAEDEFELNSEGEGDIETAMQEALEAVEKASRSAPDKGVEPGDLETAADEEVRAGEVGVAQLEQEIADLRDRSVRTLADFDNYRKRVERERADERRYAAIDVFRELLTVLDNLERALAADGSAEDLKAGVELILRQMKDLLSSSGVQKVSGLGKEFDPRIHEAISRHEDPEVTVPTVSEELQAGYLLHERLLRPAIVKVALPVAGESAPDSAAETEGDADS